MVYTMHQIQIDCKDQVSATGCQKSRTKTRIENLTVIEMQGFQADIKGFLDICRLVPGIVPC